MDPYTLAQLYFADLGLDELPETERNEFLADVGQVIYESVMRRVWNALEFSKQDELAMLVAQSTDEPDNEDRAKTLADFIKANVPDFDRYVMEEVASLREAQAKAETELA